MKRLSQYLVSKNFKLEKQTMGSYEQADMREFHHSPRNKSGHAQGWYLGERAFTITDQVVHCSNGGRHHKQNLLEDRWGS